MSVAVEDILGGAEVLGVDVAVVCSWCECSPREVRDCGGCNGTGEMNVRVSLAELRRLLDQVPPWVAHPEVTS